jgi:plasmid segregation protein ParM
VKSIGTDQGYGFCKVASDKGEFIFPSIIGTPDISRFGVEANGTRQLVVNGTAHLIGQDAVEQSRMVQRREDRRWYESTEYDILFRAALDLVINGNGGTHQILLVTGLPLAFYDDKEDLQRRLTGNHTVQRRGDPPRHANIRECRVVPQPFGSLFSLAFNPDGTFADANLLQSRVGIIDIGSKTTNLLASTHAKELTRESGSVDSGGWDIIRALRTHLDHNFRDIDLRDHDIAQVVANRSIRYYGRSVDLSDTIDEITQPFAEQVFAQASKLWNQGAAMDTILISGGGAHLVGTTLKRHFQRHADVRIVPDPQMANVRGYFRYAKFLAEKLEG